MCGCWCREGGLAASAEPLPLGGTAVCGSARWYWHRPRPLPICLKRCCPLWRGHVGIHTGFQRSPSSRRSTKPRWKFTSHRGARLRGHQQLPPPHTPETSLWQIKGKEPDGGSGSSPHPNVSLLFGEQGWIIKSQSGRPWSPGAPLPPVFKEQRDRQNAMAWDLGGPVRRGASPPVASGNPACSMTARPRAGPLATPNIPRSCSCSRHRARGEEATLNSGWPCAAGEAAGGDACWLPGRRRLRELSPGWVRRAWGSQGGWSSAPAAAPGPPPGRGHRGAAGHFEHLPVPGPQCHLSALIGHQGDSCPAPLGGSPACPRWPYPSALWSRPELPACAPPQGARAPRPPYKYGCNSVVPRAPARMPGSECRSPGTIPEQRAPGRASEPGGLTGLVPSASNPWTSEAHLPPIPPRPQPHRS